jgi:hypothetical protein
MPGPKFRARSKNVSVTSNPCAIRASLSPQRRVFAAQVICLGLGALAQWREQP